MESYPIKEKSHYEVRRVSDEPLWELYKDGDIFYPRRQFTTRSQAFMALGLLEMLHEHRQEIDYVEYERLLITNNLLITGKQWVTE